MGNHPRSMGDRGTREDDLTVAVGQIVEANTALQQQLARGFPRQILEAWEAWLMDPLVPWKTIGKRKMMVEWDLIGFYGMRGT